MNENTEYSILSLRVKVKLTKYKTLYKYTWYKRNDDGETIKWQNWGSKAE